MPRAERREQIVRAAATVFVSGGFDGTSMEDVAKAAGVTRLIVYRIFESKEALYLAVLSSVIDDVAESFDIAPAAEQSQPREAIAAMLLGVARRQPDGFRLLWRHASNEPEFSWLAANFKRSANQYAVALLSTSLADAAMVKWAAESLVSHLYESICLWLDRGTEARDPVFLRMLSEGVRAMVNEWVRISLQGGTAPL
jgi:AcrR family transcriptional regulator